MLRTLSISKVPIAGPFGSVKRKSLIFFFGVSRLFFFFWRKSRVEKKTEKCMIRDLRFFCDATYTKKKVTQLTLFLIRDLRQKKINKRVTLFFYIKKRVTPFFFIKKRVTLFFSYKKASYALFLYKKASYAFFLCKKASYAFL